MMDFDFKYINSAVHDSKELAIVETKMSRLMALGAAVCRKRTRPLIKETA